METIFFPYIEEGIIVNPHFESHKRGRNWVCKIKGKNSVEFTRENITFKGRKIIANQIKIGDAIEMGGDYISSSGNRKPDRGYYYIDEITNEGIKAFVFESIAKLLKTKNLIDNSNKQAEEMGLKC